MIDLRGNLKKKKLVALVLLLVLLINITAMITLVVKRENQAPNESEASGSGITSPWANGGPTAVWTNDADTELVMCNKTICWRRDIASNKWLEVFDINTKESFKSLTPAGGVDLKKDGIEYAWTNRSGSTQICSKNICYVGPFTGPFGKPEDISNKSFWATKYMPKKGADGTYLFDNGGPKLAWKRPDDRENLMNLKYQWVYLADTDEWLQDGTAFDVSTDNEMTGECPDSKGQCNNVKAGPNGITFFKNGGPTSSWSVGDDVTICNTSVCWISLPNGGWKNGGVPFDLSTDPLWANPPTIGNQPPNTTPGASPSVSGGPSKCTKPIVGDFDDSCKVDIRDFVKFAEYYKKRDTKADLDLDGEITIGDFVEFKNVYLKFV